MTRSETGETRDGDLHAIREWQRRFESDTARGDALALTAHLRKHGHDLLGLLQIVDLVSQLLDQQCTTPALREPIDDLVRTTGELKATAMTMFRELPREPSPGVAVAEVVVAAIGRVQLAIAGVIELRLDVGDAMVACTRDELEHLVIGLILDAAGVPRIDLLVRRRAIEGVPWIELVRDTDAIAGDRFELRIVETIASRRDGEVTFGERRDGGEELVIALPALAAGSA